MVYWESAHQWSPFKIDALGLVTILGLDEIDRSFGCLTRSWLTDWLPYLGAHVVASNRFTLPIPGFTLYNVSDGIVATDLTGWLSRWLLTEEVTFNSTTLYISQSTQSRQIISEISAFAIGFCAIAPITVIVCILRDWWGLANVVSMAVSVAVRQYALQQNQKALGSAVAESRGDLNAPVKVFLTMPTGQAVTIIASRGTIINGLLTTPRPPNPSLYKFLRMMGWVAFACHVISLGMTCLFGQLLSVVVLIGATVLKIHHYQDDKSCIGSALVMQRIDEPGRDFRAAAYARLQLSQKEEESMMQWNLFPHTSNEHWWARYRRCTTEHKLGAFEIWDQLLASKQEKQAQ